MNLPQNISLSLPLFIYFFIISLTLSLPLWLTSGPFLCFLLEKISFFSLSLFLYLSFSLSLTLLKKIFVHKICQMQNENHKKSNISFARSTSTSKTYWSDAILVPKSPWTSPFLTFWNTSLILLLRTKTSFVLRYESFNLVFGFLGKLYFDCLPCKIALNKLVK